MMTTSKCGMWFTASTTCADVGGVLVARLVLCCDGHSITLVTIWAFMVHVSVCVWQLQARRPCQTFGMGACGKNDQARVLYSTCLHVIKPSGCGGSQLSMVCQLLVYLITACCTLTVMPLNCTLKPPFWDHCLPATSQY